LRAFLFSRIHATFPAHVHFPYWSNVHWIFVSYTRMLLSLELCYER
jgi:hypothetical protein